MSKGTVQDWIAGFKQIDCTISKRSLAATITKVYRPKSFGFDKHGKPFGNVIEWVKAKLDGQEYQIIVHQPKTREGQKPRKKVFYSKI